MIPIVQYYEVAGHRFAIEATQSQFALLPNYTPFLTDEKAGTYMFIIRVQDIPSNEVRAYVDTAAMLSYALCTVEARTLLFHASVVVREGKGYLFLGRSGTGKSTHSRQWFQAFDDARLLNDDNPVVRIMSDGSVRVFGSPWSGKTPCYRNENAAVAAMVQLKQAPYNKMVPLKMTQAYPYILASVSGLKLQPDIMNRLYESIAQLLELVPVYELECLPTIEAAQLCAQTCLS